MKKAKWKSREEHNDYIGVQWEDIPAVQMSLEDFLK